MVINANGFNRCWEYDLGSSGKTESAVNPSTLEFEACWSYIGKPCYPKKLPNSKHLLLNCFSLCSVPARFSKK